MNDQELLVTKGDTAVAVISRGRGEGFMFIRLDVGPYALDAVIADAHAKGFDTFAGAMAVVNGQAVARCNPGLDNMRVMMAAAFEYARLVADRLQTQPKDDFVEFAERLWSLEDPRTDA